MVGTLAFFPVFLSVAVVVRNQEQHIREILEEIAAVVAPLVRDYELIVIDNASTDDNIGVLKRITGEGGLPNIQVYGLTKEVHIDTACWVGFESALGDFVVAIDPMTDDISFLPGMLENAAKGADVVFANNQIKPKQSFPYRSAYSIFYGLYRVFHGIDLANAAPQYRVLNRRLVNFILQHPQPVMTYRHLPATGGFNKVNLEYSSEPRASHLKSLANSIDRGSRLLVSTTHAPMRLVTTLSLFGAVANLLYSFYVMAIAFLKPDVAEGWVSTSLQQSGMFFLISLVLMVLGEYILNMTTASNEGPLYYVGQEFTSARMVRKEKLNVEVTDLTAQPFLALQKIK